VEYKEWVVILNVDVSSLEYNISYNRVILVSQVLTLCMSRSKFANKLMTLIESVGAGKPYLVVSK